MTDYPESVEDLKARAVAIALDTTIAALARKPMPSKKLQLDDALHILEHAIGNFGEFDDHRVKDAAEDLWRAYQVMELAVAAVESEYPSEPEPHHDEEG